MQTLNDNWPDNWRLIKIDRNDHSPAHTMAFAMVPPTCSIIGQTLNQLRQDIEKEYQIKPEDNVALDLAIHRAISQIKINVTEPLRRALIHSCYSCHKNQTPTNYPQPIMPK